MNLPRNSKGFQTYTHGVYLSSGLLMLLMLDHVVFYSQWGSIGGGGRPNLGGGVVGSGGWHA